jgi:iron complex transport system ATP-binding protein
MAAVSVRDVVAQARHAHRTRFGRSDPGTPAVTRAIERTELQGLALRAFDTLSGGEQRRVLLARALATEARILVFDEPTAGLDVAHALRFFELAKALKADQFALVCVLHELGDALRYADDALLLDAGASVAFGRASDALNESNIARVYEVHSHERVALGFSLDGEWR